MPAISASLSRFCYLATLLALSQCSPSHTPNSNTPSARLSSHYPQIINVSAYDPKERQRSGQGYSEHNLSALRANGASALIARAGKGGSLDDKCAAFLSSADRIGLLPGIYYRVQSHINVLYQADQFVQRAFHLAKSRSWRATSLLLCADFDGDLTLHSILQFMDRVIARTGVTPVAYLENSTHLKQIFSQASPATKAKLRLMPYWLALYSHESGAGPIYPAPGSPRGLLQQYDVWSNWTLWQYGGVEWSGGRSQPKVYNHGSYRFTPYFGSLDRPIERSIFNGSNSQLLSFWNRHGLRL